MDFSPARNTAYSPESLSPAILSSSPSTPFRSQNTSPPSLGPVSPFLSESQEDSLKSSGSKEDRDQKGESALHSDSRPRVGSGGQKGHTRSFSDTSPNSPHGHPSVHHESKIASLSRDLDSTSLSHNRTIAQQLPTPNETIPKATEHIPSQHQTFIYSPPPNAVQNTSRLLSHISPKMKSNYSDTQLFLRDQSIEDNPGSHASSSSSSNLPWSHQSTHAPPNPRKPLFINTSVMTSDRMPHSGSTGSLASSTHSTSSTSISIPADWYHADRTDPRHSSNSLPSTPVMYVSPESKSVLQRAATSSNFYSLPNSPAVPYQNSMKTGSMHHSSSHGSLSEKHSLFSFINKRHQQQQQHNLMNRDPDIIWSNLSSQAQSQKMVSVPHQTLYLSSPDDVHRYPRFSVLHPFTPERVGQASPESSIDESISAFVFDKSCHQKYVKLSVNAIPSDAELMEKCAIPFGAVISPFSDDLDDQQIPLAGHPASGIVRCKECRSYINPFSSFTDAGRKWICNICYLINDVPEDYYASLDTNGKRVDMDAKPELHSGSFEYIATSDYYTHEPNPSCFLFLIDSSSKATQSGWLMSICLSIKKSLRELCQVQDDTSRVGFMAFDEYLHFYHISLKNGKAREYIMTDLVSGGVPFPTGIFIDLKENIESVCSLLDKIPLNPRVRESSPCALGSAMQSALKIMNQTCGRLLIFQSETAAEPIFPPTNDAKPAKEKKQEGHISSKEFYTKLASLFSSSFICVDYFVFGDHENILHTSYTSRKTGGEIHRFPLRGATEDIQRLDKVVRDIIIRQCVMECVMRVRCSPEFKLGMFQGSLMMKAADLCILGHSDPKKTYSVMIESNSRSVQSKVFSIQVALLYVTRSGLRKIRIHNVAVPVTPNYVDICLAANCKVIGSLIIKNDWKPPNMKAKVIKQMADILIFYQRAIKSKSSTELSLPDSFAYLPLIILSLLKFPSLRYGEKDNTKNTIMSHNLCTWSIEKTLVSVHPILLPLSCFTGKIYILYSVNHALIRAGLQVTTELLYQAFGVDNHEQLRNGLYSLPKTSSPLNQAIQDLFAYWGNIHPLDEVVIFLEDSPLDSQFKQLLVEDELENSFSYYEFLNHVNRLVVSTRRSSFSS